MRIKGTKHESVEITVSASDAWSQLRVEILRAADIEPHWYLVSRNPGHFYEDEDSRHGSSGDVLVQAATNAQIEVFKAVKKIDGIVHTLGK